MKSKPVFGERPFGKKDARFLLIAYFDPNGIETIPEGIVALQAFSRHEISILNMWPGRNAQLVLPSDLDLRTFEGVIVHPTISYFPSTVVNFDSELDVTFQQFEGVKILMKQDEQVNSGQLAPLVQMKRFDIVFTCLPSSEHEKVYPKSIVGDECTLIQTLTGYISPAMRHLYRSGEGRNLGVTYRGSIQPLEFGRLGYEKRGIGYDVVGALATSSAGIAYDISSRWEDRLSGIAWQDFLRGSNVVLGVESGSNIFDYDGKVAKWCREYNARHIGENVASYSYYARAHEEFLHTVEGNVNYAQISPRHFEAASAGAAQLLYEGVYSNLFLPDRHFFSLKKDLSNIDAAIDFMRDEIAQKRMAECAFEEIIMDRRNWYEGFAAKVDDAIDAKLAEKGVRKADQSAVLTERKPLAYVLCAHDPQIDPRVTWVAESLRQKNYEVVVIGTFPLNVIGAETEIKKSENGIHLVRTERTRHLLNWVPNMGELVHGKVSHGRQMLAALADYAGMATPILKRKLGGEVAYSAEVDRFRQICEYMVNTNSALLNVIDKLGPPNLLVGVDLEALFAAVICGETSGAKVVFDAHEYWPYSYTDFQHWEIEFWSAMEGRLAALTDINIGVTPQLCKLMGHEYGVDFRPLPNAASSREGQIFGLDQAFSERLVSNPLRILYQGGFGRGRGLEEIIRAFALVKSEAQLIMRGPPNEYRDQMIDLARSLGMDESRISFPRAVAESELISTALQADIGLIPYNPVWFGYRYRCPNKLSQYAAAGLPILSSTTQFVADIVQKNNIGYVVDISNLEQVAAKIDELNSNRSELAEKGRQARRFFEEAFNWEGLSHDLFEDIMSLTKDMPLRQADLDHFGRESEVAFSKYETAFQPTGSLYSPGVDEGLATARLGASVIGSSAFHPFPNDAAYLIRPKTKRGYASAFEKLDGSPWIEIDLGSIYSTGRIEIEWYSQEDRAVAYRVLHRLDTKAEWNVLVDEESNNRVVATYKFQATKTRFIRLEAVGFAGQPRLIVRGFRILKAEGVAEAVEEEAVEARRSALEKAALALIARGKSVSNRGRKWLGLT